MSNPSASDQQQQVDVDRRTIGPWQAWLEQHCTKNHLRPPIYSIASDRRGGRTAWSAAVEVNGTGYNARFWYDGNFMTNAKEDAAEVALDRLETPEEHQNHKEHHYEYNQQLLAQSQAQAHGQTQTQPSQQSLQPDHQPDEASQHNPDMWQGFGR